MLLCVAETYFLNLQAYSLMHSGIILRQHQIDDLFFATLILITVFATSLVYRKWGFLGDEGILSQRGEGERSAEQFQFFSYISS